VDKSKIVPAKFDYPLETIAKAISKKRLGGVAFINYVGGGETLLPIESLKLIKLFLEEGHFLQIVSNLTLTDRVDSILKFPKELLNMTTFFVSLHYAELKRKNLMNEFIGNINKLKKANVSFTIGLSMSPEYMPIAEEIKEFCLKEIGFLPDVGFSLDRKNGWKRYDCFTKDIVKNINNLFDYPEISLFDSCFGSEKYRKEFCYMGDFGFIYHLQSGTINYCFDTPKPKNGGDICKNLSKPIEFEAVGTCCSRYCACGPILQPFGVIPEFDKAYPTFYNLYKKRSFVSGYFSQYLDNKLSETNEVYSKIKQLKIRLKRKFNKNFRKCIKKITNKHQ
jgi:hypothetical protein